MTTKLYRSQRERMLGGVCGGLSQYMGIDPTLVRLFFVLLALANGLGVLAYLALWIVIPPEGQGEVAAADTVRAGTDEIAERARSLGQSLRGSNGQAGAIIGVALIALGTLFLLQSLNIVWLRWFNFDVLWPLLLIAAGLALMWHRVRGG